MLRRVIDMRTHVARARTAGPIADGSYRVVVSEPDGRWTVQDCPDLDRARRYADDAASETENGVVLSRVLDHCFDVKHAGRHY